MTGKVPATKDERGVSLKPTAKIVTSSDRSSHVFTTLFTRLLSYISSELTAPTKIFSLMRRF